MIRRNPFPVIVQIFVHVDKPYILQADPLFIDHVHKIGILSHRSHRADQYRTPVLLLIRQDLFCHLFCHLIKYRRIILHADQLHLWICQKLFFIVTIVSVPHNHSLLLSSALAHAAINRPRQPCIALLKHSVTKINGKCSAPESLRRSPLSCCSRTSARVP